MYQTTARSTLRLMLPKILTLATAALILTGCSTTAAAQPAEDTDCISLSAGVQAALEAGLNGGYTLTSATAIEHDGAWWVAAKLDGDPDVTAVWYTQQNPEGNDAAFTSATKLASLTSIYLMPEDLTGSATVNEATACL